MSPPIPLVQVDNVSFSYGRQPILDNINLTIHQGNFLGLIGPNGSGKTTLLKIILGLLTPTEGTASLFGQPLGQFQNWHRLGYVPQRAGIQIVAGRFPITVEEVVGMGVGGFFRTQKSKKAIANALAAVEITNLKRLLLTELSGGQQQRVFIARALVWQPELLILDEPTVGIDVESQTTFYRLLKQLNQEQKLTLVLVSHDIDVVAHEVKTVACLNRRIVFHGEPKKVTHADFLEKLYGKNIKFVVHGH